MLNGLYHCASSNSSFLTTQWSEHPPNPNQMRWKPFDIPDKESVDWVDGLRTVAGDHTPGTRIRRQEMSSSS